MSFEKPNKIEAEKGPTIEIISSSNGPKEFKENPFFNEYSSAMVDWDEKKLYLPDSSDEAISFSMASHELGHLVKKGRIQPDRENFKNTYQEELRAWDLGWKYLEKYFSEYYDNEEAVINLKAVVEKIKNKLLKITLLTEPFYQNPEAKDSEQQRLSFLQTEQGQHIKNEIDGLKEFVEKTLVDLGKELFLKKINWDIFTGIIKKALIDIERDNEVDI